MEDELTEGKIKLLLRKKKTGKRIYRSLKLHYCGNVDLNKPDDVPVARKPMRCTWGGALRDDTKNGCVADYPLHQGVPYLNFVSFLVTPFRNNRG